MFKYIILSLLFFSSISAFEYELRKQEEITITENGFLIEGEKNPFLSDVIIYLGDGYYQVSKSFHPEK